MQALTPLEIWLASLETVHDIQGLNSHAPKASAWESSSGSGFHWEGNISIEFDYKVEVYYFSLNYFFTVWFYWVVLGNELRELMMSILHNRMIKAVRKVIYNKDSFWISSHEGYFLRWVKKNNTQLKSYPEQISCI